MSEKVTKRIDEIGFGGLKLAQDPKTFCFGIDAVLLAAFAAEHAKNAKQNALALDIGTNTGVIPLILSHKTDWVLKGVEVQSEAFELAEENIALNGLGDRLEFFNCDIKDALSQDLKDYEGRFDVITINPPYMEATTGMKSDNTKKMIARHETTATLSDFIAVAAKLLKERGELFIIHRPMRLGDLIAFGRANRLEAKEMLMIAPKAREAANLVLLHYIKGAGKELVVLPELKVYESDGSYTDEILRMYEKK